MMTAQAGASALPFFMDANPGQRFCLLHLPAPGHTPRGAIVYIHPFAEEMNKSRRMAAIQARAFAGAGYGVLQIDLYGCGDSSGEFSGARWHIWKRDLVLACEWLARRVDGPLSIWGLRLGALLALELASQSQERFERVILWHPVFKGKTHIDQFLRMERASRMLTASARQDDAPSARQQLAGGASIEVGGYTLAPELVVAIDGADAAAHPPACAIDWFEQASDCGVAPAAASQAERWHHAGAALTLHPVPGLAFWGSTEIIECQALLAATATLYT
ncbi:exosortase A-associated hydrolase 2 [Oxalobacteraceae bacterium GrIS 1.11]